MKKLALWSAALAIATTPALAQVDPTPPAPPAPVEDKATEADRDARIAKLRAELDELRTKQEAIRQELRELGAADSRPRVERLRRAEPPTGGMDGLPEEMRRQIEDMRERMRDMEKQFGGPGGFGPGGSFDFDIKTDGSASKKIMSMQSGPDGVTVTVTEDKDGKEVTKTYEAESTDELVKKYPELKGYGILGDGPTTVPGFRFGPGSGATIRRFGTPIEPTPPTPLVPAPLAPAADDQNRLGVSIDTTHNEPGLLVQSVEPKTLAEDLGIEAGDIILEVGTDEVSEPADVRPALRRIKAGEEVRVKIERDGAEQILTAKKPGRGRSL